MLEGDSAGKMRLSEGWPLTEVAGAGQGDEGWRPAPPRPAEHRSILNHPDLQALHDFWSARLVGGLVDRRDVDVLDLGRWLGCLILVDVLDGGADFLCRVHGTELVRHFGYDMTGKRLRDHLPPRHRDAALAEYREAAFGGRPIAATILERTGSRWVRWEKLMLPLARGGAATGQVVAGLYRTGTASGVEEIAPGLQPDPLPPEHPRLRQLLAFWQTKAGSRAMPARRDLDPLELKPWLGHLNLMQVIDGGRDFNYRIHGSELVSAAGYELTGKLLSRSASPQWRSTAAENRLCVEAGAPVRFARIHRPGRLYNGFEKLVLPLAPSGRSIDYLLAGLYPPERA